MMKKKILYTTLVSLTCCLGAISLVCSYFLLLDPIEYYNLSLLKTAVLSPLFHLFFGVCIALLLTYCSKEKISLKTRPRIVILSLSIALLLIHVLVRLLVYAPSFPFLRTLFGVWGTDIFLRSPYMLEFVGIFLYFCFFPANNLRRRNN